MESNGKYRMNFGRWSNRLFRRRTNYAKRRRNVINVNSARDAKGSMTTELIFLQSFTCCAPVTIGNAFPREKFGGFSSSTLQINSNFGLVPVYSTVFGKPVCANTKCYTCSRSFCNFANAYAPWAALVYQPTVAAFSSGMGILSTLENFDLSPDYLRKSGFFRLHSEKFIMKPVYTHST